MQIRKFEGDSVHDALKKVKKELGPEAYILSTKTVRPAGVRGLWEKPRVEISAALDYVPGAASTITEKAPEALAKPGGGIEDDVKELKGMVASLLYRMPRRTAGDDGKDAYSLLIEAGLDEGVAARLSREMDGMPADEGAYDVLFKTLAGGVQTGRGVSESGRRAAVFMGPTGVGKTTTIAKLAALFALRDNLKVGLFTLDTYRVAAVDQLRMYARIMDVPLEVLSSPRDIGPALRRHSDKDLVLIDTSGRSHRDAERMGELNAMFDCPEPISAYLMLSATTSTDVMKDTIDCYAGLPVDSLIFTKIDEGARYGNLYSALVHSGKPLSYITTGQQVPEDIEAATAEKMASLVLGRRA